jgi:integrase/recombinase XerC
MKHRRPQARMTRRLKIMSEQVGHAYAATTALYTNVSDDFKNRTLAKSLARAFTPPAVAGER